MDKIYLFGAGINAYGIISYIGKENVIAVIDNNEKKQGNKIMDIPIISFADFLDQYDGKEVVITAAICDDMICQLENSNIENYSISPMVTTGAILNPDKIAECCKDSNRIYLVGQNILMKKFCELFLKIKMKHKFIVDSEKIQNAFKNIKYVRYEDIPEDADIILFKENLNDEDKQWLSKFKKVCDIYKLKITNYMKIKKYKEKHKNKKCFIVGNGPSLKIDDLNRIYRNNICSFGLNLIYKMFSDTIWRPTFLAISDYTLYRTYYDDIKNMNNQILFVRDFYEVEDTPHIKGINYFPSSGKRDYYDMQKFSTDITKNVYSGYTVMYDAMQIAVYMGFTEIYLIGADFSYLGEAIKQGNHVYDYKEKDKRDVSGTIHIDVSLNAFKLAKKYAEENGIKIYNATRGGKLEVFERKDLDELFKETENQ